MAAPGGSRLLRKGVGIPCQGASALPMEAAVELESDSMTASEPKAAVGRGCIRDGWSGPAAVRRMAGGVDEVYILRHGWNLPLRPEHLSA